MFEKYDAYKDSNNTELPNVPVGWKVDRIKYEIQLLTGYPFNSSKYSEEGIKLVRGINVKESVLDWKDTAYWPEVTPDLQRYLLKDGDLLIGMDGSKVGKNFCQISEQDLPLLLLQRVARLRVKSFLNARYLYWNLASKRFLNWINKSKTDPMIPHMAPKDINDFVIAFPPVSEQEEIALFLDNKTSEIDQAIALKEKQIALLNERKQIIIQKAVTQGLDSNVPMKDSGMEWIGKIPEHWEILKLKNLALVNPTNTTLANCLDKNTSVCFLAMENVETNGTVDYQNRRNLASVKTGFTSFVKNDVLVAKITPCFENGKGALLDMLDTQIGFGSTEFHVLRVKQNCNPKFLYYVTKSHSFMDMGEGMMIGSAGQKRVPTSFIQNYVVAIPDKNAQAEIVNFIDQRLNEISEAINLQKQQIEKLKEYKTTLINNAVTGKIKVA